MDAVVDRLDLACRVARADEEEVGVADDAAHVEFDDVDRLLVGRLGGDRLYELLWGHHRYSLPRAMCSATECRDEVSDREPLRDPPADERRRDVQPRHVEEHRVRCFAETLRQPVDDVLPPGSRALRHRQLRQTEHRLGLVPARQSEGDVAPDDEGQVVLRRARMKLPQGIDRVRRTAAQHLEVADAEALVARDRQAGRARGAPAARDRSSASLCGGAATGVNSTRSRPSCAAASEAQTRWARCGGLNEPPRMPIRATRLPLAVPVGTGHHGRTWPSPATTYFSVHSSRTPIGPRACSFCVELPISAPMPNSPPSVKRVEALT